MSTTTDDPVDELLSRMRTAVDSAVDTLHVAAMLESSGVTDVLAQDRYHHADVFALATTLRARAVPPGALARHPGARPVLAKSRREALQQGRAADVATAGGVDATSLGHGVIYLLPALSMPALLDLVGSRHAATALVVGASVGWVWAVLATWNAYGVLSLEGRAAAERHLRMSVLAGVAVGLMTGAALVLGGAPGVVGAVAAGVTAAQLGTTLLFFLGRRTILVWVLLVQGAAGLANLLAPGAVPAVLVLAVFTLATVALLVVGGTPHGAGPTHDPVGPSRSKPMPLVARLVPRRGFLPVLGYALGSVAFLLLPQIGFLRNGGGVALVLAGLFLTMGFVEWRGAVMSARARTELSRTTTVAGFRQKIAGLALRECLACMAVTGLGTAFVMTLLHLLDLFSPGVLPVALATVTLAAAYLLCLVLANTGAYAWLASSFTGGAVVETSLWRASGGPPTVAFVVASGVLLVALLIGLLRRPVNRFR